MTAISPETGLAGLALSAFLSATLLPGGSEVILLWLARQGEIDTNLLILVATAANTLGGFSTYLVGVGAQLGIVRRWSLKPPSPRAMIWIRRWSFSALLLSWLPVIGDGLCLAAGWLRLPWLATLTAILLGKAARYAAVVYVAGLL